MAQQPRKSRAWIWVLVIFGFLFIAIICGLAGIVITLASGSPSQASSGGAVAIVRIEGTIIEGEEGAAFFSSGNAFSRTIMNQIKDAADNPAVKAIVLRINSPGGGVVASDDIYREVLRAKEKGKKIVVSMGTEAASGGYYVSAAADRIVASPGTFTGSIGVIAIIPDATELMNKIGVGVTIVKSGAYKDEGSPFRPMTADEVSYFQSMIDEAYNQFVYIVAKGRNMDPDSVRRIADGRVYTGQHAQELGLVDELGDLQRAIDIAAQLGGITGKPRIIEPKRPGFFSSLFGSRASVLIGPSPLADFENEGRATLQYLHIQ